MAHIVLIVQSTASGVSLTWSDGPAAFASYELSAKSLTASAEGARKALGAVVECFFSEDGTDAPAATAALAGAGYALYQALFKTPAEQQSLATSVRKWLDQLQAEGAVELLEIVAEGEIAVPWNLVYDRRPDPAAFKGGSDDPARWRPFWGLRYDLSGGRRVSPLRRLPVIRNPRVVVVTDPLVIDRLVPESAALTALCQENGWTQARSREELAAALQGGRPDILYWLGHTQTEPFGLVLGEDVITPDDLKTLMEGDPFADAGEVFGGVAFLNACGTAGGDKSGSFLEALHPLGLSGYIATEQSTVDTFAAPLGHEFLSAFVVRGESLGSVMRTLRGRVPLGLLYGSYCPSAIHVRRDPLDPSADGAPIVLTRAAFGVKLGRAPVQTATESHPLPPLPYRSLRAYSAADRALFAGRDDDTLRFAQLLDEPATRLVILHGESGVGKTSFLRAGVVPYLERECIGYRFARDRSDGEGDSVLLVRATNDPVSQIATALTAYCSRPLTFRTPLGEEVAVDLPCVFRSAVDGRTDRDALRDALRADPSLLGQLLSDLARKLPFVPVLVIDQAEEVFTLARTAADEENRNLALEMLRRAAAGPAGFKIVVSLRTEYHGRFTDRLRKGTRAAKGVRDYLLTDFGLEALIEVIRRPTSSDPIEYTTEIPSKTYGFRYAAGVAEQIARRAREYTINRSDSVLPLVQVICSQLYDRVRALPDGTITLSDLDAIGGVEGGMRAHAEGLVSRLFPSRADRKAFVRLLSDPGTQLFIRQSDGTLTTALLPAAFLARHWSGYTPFEDMLRIAGAGDWRLVRVNSLRIGSDEEERPYVSLGHDALAKVAARWQEERNRWRQLRRSAAVVIGVIAVSALLFVNQSQAARRDADDAAKKLKEAQRQSEIRDNFADLFAAAQQAASGSPPDWDATAHNLSSADVLSRTYPDAVPDDWPLKQSAQELLARAKAALADADARRREHEKFKQLGEKHSDAVFFSTQPLGLGESETRARVRASVKEGLDLFRINETDGPLKLAREFFTPDESRLVAHRCYELLLLDAQARAEKITGEDNEAHLKRVREALDRLDRADGLLAGTRTRSGLMRRAAYLAALGRPDEAMRAEAEDTAPVLAVDHFLMGLEHQHRGEYAKALSFLSAALKIEPSHYGAQFLLGVCYLQLKQPQEAKVALSQCLRLRSEFVWPRLYRALAEIDLARRQMGDYSDAVADLNHVLLADSLDGATRYAALTNLGFLEFNRRNWPAAIENLEKAIHGRPGALAAYINLALTHRERANEVLHRAHVSGLAPVGAVALAVACADGSRALDAAAKVLDDAIKEQPNVARLYHERAGIRLLRGDTAAARDDLFRAVSLRPTTGAVSIWADDLLELGRLMHNDGEYAAAALAYQTVLNALDNSPSGDKRATAARRLAESLLVMKNYEDAARALDLYLGLTPIPSGLRPSDDRARQLAGALTARGLIYAQQKNSRAALDCYTRSLGFVPDPDVLALRGWAYLAAGANALGQKDFEEALTQSPRAPNALLGRAEVRARAGQLSEARADVDTALRNIPADTRPQTRCRLFYNAARVLAQVAPREPDPGATVSRAASLLGRAIADVQAGERAKFWSEAVLADPALNRISVSAAMRKVAAEYGVDKP